jgi:hypothetical protein
MILYTLSPVRRPGICGLRMHSKDRMLTFFIEGLDDALLFPLHVLKPVGRHEDGKVYDGPYGGAAIGRTERKDGSGYWLLQDKREENKKVSRILHKPSIYLNYLTF